MSMAAIAAPRRWKRKMPALWDALLLRLLNGGAASKYVIAKDKPFVRRYPAVYKALDSLEEWGLVHHFDGGTARTGLAIKTFDLTAPGLAYALHTMAGKADWPKVAARHKDLLPKVFGEWDYLVAQGGQEFAKKSLLGTVETFWNDYDYETGYGSTNEMNEKVCERLSRVFILTPRGSFADEELVRWYELVGGNRRLKSWAVQTLHQVIGERLSELDGRIYDLTRLRGPLSREEKRMLGHLADHAKSKPPH